jgi:phosphatidylglycerol---prolipoprotein diacylglyceryl transferase
VPWGMVFPRAADTFPQFASIEPTPRHPSQLYESFAEGLLLFLVLRVLTHTYGGLKRPGLVTGAFLLGYAIARSSCEMFRQPDPAHALTVGLLTPGIAYSIPMAILAFYFIHLSRRDSAPAIAGGGQNTAG